MPAFTNRVESNAEEGEERPEKRDDDPASEEIAGEFIGSAVESQRPGNEQC